jgi:hypothetical protein
MNIDSRFLINLVAFQIGWFACVWGGANQAPALGAVAVAVIVAIHLTYTARRPGPELTLILVAAAIGIVWDSTLVAFGWLSYPSGTVVAGTAPYWIVAMWMSFATTLNVSLGWLKKRYVLAALFGAVGGPMAYYAGFKLGGVQFSSMTVGLAAQAAGWAIMMPLMTILAERLNGMRPALLLAAEERG